MTALKTRNESIEQGERITDCASICVDAIMEAVEKRVNYRICCSVHDMIRILNRAGLSVRKQKRWEGCAITDLAWALNCGNEQSIWLVLVKLNGEGHVLAMDYTGDSIDTADCPAWTPITAAWKIREKRQ